MGSDASRVRAGFFYGVAAYGAWGLVPLYFNQLKDSVPAKEIIAHRVVWSAVLLLVILTVFRRWPEIQRVFRSPWLTLMLLASAYFVASNWYVYVYAATSNRVTQASLGYFILPLANAFAGVLIFRERLTFWQGLALGLAALGVLYMALGLGLFPWISIFLAVTFAIYGILRKLTPVDGIVGLSVETFLLAPVALAALWFWDTQTGLGFGQHGRTLDIWIICSGVVTTFPLVCFAQAVRRVSLIAIGFLQYLSPSLQLVVAIFANDEPFTREHQISFGLIWLGLLVLGVEKLVGELAKRTGANKPAVVQELVVANFTTKAPSPVYPPCPKSSLEL